MTVDEKLIITHGGDNGEMHLDCAELNSLRAADEEEHTYIF